MGRRRPMPLIAGVLKNDGAPVSRPLVMQGSELVPPPEHKVAAAYAKSKEPLRPRAQTPEGLRAAMGRVSAAPQSSVTMDTSFVMERGTVSRNSSFRRRREEGRFSVGSAHGTAPVGETAGGRYVRGDHPDLPRRERRERRLAEMYGAPARRPEREEDYSAGPTGAALSRHSPQVVSTVSCVHLFFLAYHCTIVWIVY